MATTIFVSDFETTLQNRLAHPQTWKEVATVIYSEKQVVTSGYVSTVPTTGSITRATVSGHNHTAIAMTAQNLTISSGQEVPVYIDFADLAQTGYNLQQEIAQEMGDLLNEYVEAQLLAQHASFTDVGDTAGAITSGVTTTISVSASNVDDMIRGIKRILRVANGQSKMRNQGVFIVWRPADFELLEAYVQAWNKIIGLVKSFLIYGENPVVGNALQAA